MLIRNPLLCIPLVLLLQNNATTESSNRACRDRTPPEKADTRIKSIDLQLEQILEVLVN